MQTIEYRKDIDALRGLSVLLVVIFHAFPVLIPGGYIGVDVFFVISGYLITQIILTSINNDDFSLIEFYVRRIRRLFPALITVLLTVMFLGWLVLFPDEYEQLGDHVAHSVIFVLNFFLIGELGYFDVESVYKPILHLWTLSVEEQYYLFWPLLLLFGLKQKHLNPLYIIALVILLSFIANIYFISNYPENVYFNTLTRVWQLASGSLLAIYSVKNKIKERKILFIVGVVLILFASFIIDEQALYPGWLALVPTLGTLLILLGRVKLQYWGGLVHIGLISYPLYLWHWVIISFLYIYIGKEPESIILICAVVLSFLLAFVTYKYIERLRYVKGGYVTILMLVSVVTLGLAGAYVKNEDGLADRSHLSYLNKFDLQFKRTSRVDSNCESYANRYLNTDRVFDYCRSNGMDAGKIIAVIGDSHAHVIYPGIAKEAGKKGYGTILLANSSCPTLIGYLYGKNPKEIAICKEKIKQIFLLLENDKRIDKVLMVTRGPAYIHGEVEGEFTKDSVENSLKVVKYSNQTYQTYFKGFEMSMTKLESMKHIRNIFYFLENPELDFLPKEVVTRPFDNWGVSTQDSTMNKKLYLLRMSEYRSHVKNYSDRFNQLKVIDPMPYLCDTEKCFSFKNGNFLYADDDHFSVYGSEYIADKIRGRVFNE